MRLGYSAGEQASLPDLQAQELYKLGIVDILQQPKRKTPNVKRPTPNAKKVSNRTDKRADHLSGSKKLH